MNNSNYRTVEALEQDQVRELHALYQGEWWSRGRSLDEVQQMIGGTDHVFALVADPGGQLAAFARVLTDGVFKALVFDVIVAPGFRDQGLGRRLMDCIIGHPTLGRVKHLELYCLPDLVPFYKKWGFSTDVSGITFLRRMAG